MTPALDLTPLLSPAAVAVVGASDRGYGGNVFYNLDRFGYRGQVAPVNPRHETVGGRPCFKSLEVIPYPFDCVVVVTGRETVLPVLEQAHARGARAAVVLSIGFAEAGDDGRKLEANLRAFGRERGMAICGPNCIGLINLAGAVPLFGARISDALRPGTVGAVMQSGASCIALANDDRGVGYSVLVSTGNEAVVSATDVLDHLVEDEGTTVLVAFLEQVRDVAAFRRMSRRARDRGKPVIVVKVGRSARGRELSVAHTGALAGADAVYHALFRSDGIIRVDDLDDLINTAELASRHRGLPGRRLGVIIDSGGEAALVSDTAAEYGLDLPDLTTGVRDAVVDILAAGSVVISNPVDVTGVGVTHTDRYEAVLEALAGDPGIDVVVVARDAPECAGTTGTRHHQAMAAAAVGVQRRARKPVVFMSNISGPYHREARSILRDGGVPFLQGTRASLRAVSRLCWWSAAARQPRPDDSRPARPLPDGSRAAVGRLLESGRATLTEHESLDVLRAYGVPSPPMGLARSEEEALTLAARIGYPVVAKVVVPGLAHKSDRGGVRTGIGSAAEMRAAYQAFAGDFGSAEAAPVDVLVQKMIDGGLECLVGAVCDPALGPAIVVGLGGTLAEVLDDTAMRVLPVSAADVEAMVGELRGRRLFDAYRGRGRRDLGAFVDAVLGVAAFVEDWAGALREMDVNPLLVLAEGQGCMAVDALIVPAPRAPTELTMEAGQ